MDTLTFGLIAFLLSMIGARMISERALRRLPGEQKLLLLDVFSGMRMYGLLIGSMALAAIFLLPKLFQEDPRIGQSIGGTIFIAWVIGRQILAGRRLRWLNVDEDYKQRIRSAQLLANIGMVILLASVLFSSMRMWV